MNANLDDILTLLALTVMADKKVLETEIDTFLEVAASIPADLGAGVVFIGLSSKPLPQSILISWLYTNNDRLKSMLEAHSFEHSVTLLFARLRWLPDKQVILRKLMIISAADNDIHVSEKALITLAARYWDEPLPELMDLNEWPLQPTNRSSLAR